MSAKHFMQEIAKANAAAKEATGDIDPERNASLLETAIATAPSRHRFMVELGEYLGVAAEGTGLDPETWRPLEHFPHLK